MACMEEALVGISGISGGKGRVCQVDKAAKRCFVGMRIVLL